MSKKVLIVEDNPADVALVKLAFKELELSHEIIHFLDGQALLDFLASNSLVDLSLILLDLNMPRKGGIEVLEHMHKNPTLRRLPVVIFTSSRADFDIQTCYELGANAFVPKPLDIKDFHQTIKAIVQFWMGVNILPSFSSSEGAERQSNSY